MKYLSKIFLKKIDFLFCEIEQMLLHQLAVENKDIFGLMMSMMNETKITLEVDDGNGRADDFIRTFNICFTTFQLRIAIPICGVYYGKYCKKRLEMNLYPPYFIDRLHQISINIKNYASYADDQTLIDFGDDYVILNRSRISANINVQLQVRKLIGELYEILIKEFPKKD